MAENDKTTSPGGTFKVKVPRKLETHRVCGLKYAKRKIREYKTADRFSYSICAKYDIRVPSKRPGPECPDDSLVTLEVEGEADGGGRVCRVIVEAGYARDGAFGPMFDVRGSMVAALVHDVLYHCMRRGYVMRESREAADKLLRAMLRKGGMGPLCTTLWYWAVRVAGRKAIKSKPRQEHRLAGVAVGVAGVALVIWCVQSRWSAHIGAIAESSSECLRSWGLDLDALCKLGGWAAVGLGLLVRWIHMAL